MDSAFLISSQLEFILRITIAALCGGVIGFERKNRLKEAGVRTHLIVALGSALMMILSKYAFMDVTNTIGFRVDPSRIASQVVTGIGFLGAGMIFIRNQTINGLTTAAGVWATAGIGMAIGSGLYLLGVCATILIIFFQIIIHRNQDFFHMPVVETIVIRAQNTPGATHMISERLKENHIQVINIKAQRLDNDTIMIESYAKLANSHQAENLMEIFSDMECIISLEF